MQMGRPIAFTPGEITTAIKRADYLVKISGDALADTDGDAEKGFKRFIRKVPVGPVLIIFAWNVSTMTTGDKLEAYLTL